MLQMLPNLVCMQVRAKEPFTPAMLREVEQYYFGHYCRHFGTPEFAAALAAIPFIFNWDDHDIFDVGLAV
jgi:phosphodiesterase/alkaline phosphatase D-like protein